MDQDPEALIQAALKQGQEQEAIRLAVVSYGPELLNFLAAVHSSQEQAAEVFAEASADLVRSLGSFRGDCRFSTWFYAIAKNASRRYFKDPYQKRKVALSQSGDLPAPVRTTTAAFLKTEWKDKLRALRDSLDPDDRALLVLRVDRRMTWSQIAMVLEPQKPSEAVNAKLRKRFERIKEKLREEAIQSGWLQND